jgi:1-acyl-sn-glycerol-3-phosphate acyltransferase
MDPLSNAYAIVKADRRPRFLAKEDLFHIPIVGRALKGARQIPVKRETGDKTAPLRMMMKALTEDQVVLIYPEGTVTKRPDHRPMEGKTGAVRLSLATGVPITPMASWGSQAIWQKSGKGSLKYGRPIWVKVGPPLDFSDRVDQANDHDALKEMTAEVIAALATLVEDLDARYPGAWSSEA